ncbi:MAG: STAS domain-containing protein [Chlorobiales bacterium]|jgi:anti-sigma B factor antagonist|nr:STAS domain-containing protein [Chlorobiales bacterium]
MATFSSIVRQTQGSSVIDLSGDLDAHTAGQLERTIQDLLNKDNFRIVVNFSKLNYISSAGLGVFMGFIDDVRSNGGDIKFSNMPGKIFQVFDLLGFPLLYEIFTDEKEALEKFNLTPI